MYHFSSKKFRILSGALLVAASLNAFATSENSDNRCIPDFIQQGQIYQFESKQQSMEAQVTDIPESGCWIQVSVVITSLGPDIPKSAKIPKSAYKKDAFWVNLNTVSAIKSQQ